MKYLIVSAVIFILTISNTIAAEKSEFIPTGKPILQSFFDYGQGFGEQKNNSGFDIKRALIGYKYQFTPSISAQVVIDGASGVSTNNRLEVYLRNALVNWKQDSFDISLGLTGLQQFGMQEKYWKHRYVYKSFQDVNGMGASVDLGISGIYKFTDYLSMDLSFTNGSGYKKIEQSGSKKTALGINLFPIKGWTVRVYGDIYNESEEMRGKLPEYITSYDFKNQYALSIFSGYQNELLSVGAEFNKVFNKQFIENKNYYGYSFYSTIALSKQWNVYGRYDILKSNQPKDFHQEWNDSDGQLIIAGIEFVPNQFLKISPNFRNINFERSKSQQYLFVNFEFKM